MASITLKNSLQHKINNEMAEKLQIQAKSAISNMFAKGMRGTNSSAKNRNSLAKNMTFNLSKSNANPPSQIQS